MIRCKRVFRREDHLLGALAGGVEDHVVHLVVLAVHLVVVVDGLHAGDAAIGVVVQRLPNSLSLAANWWMICSGGTAGLGDVHLPEARVESHGRKAVLALRRGGQGAGRRQQQR